MEIQSLSVVVPGGCPNACKFCVSKLHKEAYPDRIDRDRAYRDLHERDWMERLQFARDNGCNTLILTGSGEPVTNPDFLDRFSGWNARIADPFRWIEVQTSGVSLDDDKLSWLRASVRVSTIALSLSNALSSSGNAEYDGMPEKLRFDIDGLCARIKERGFNLRLCLNMTDAYEGAEAQAIFRRCAALGADQVTFRVLYDVDSALSPQIHDWIVEHRASQKTLSSIKSFIKDEGRPLERLPYGAMRYSVMGMSTVLDEDCMSKAEEAPAIRYLILRPDCRLYTKWDDRGSMLF